MRKPFAVALLSLLLACNGVTLPEDCRLTKPCTGQGEVCQGTDPGGAWQCVVPGDCPECDSCCEECPECPSCPELPTPQCPTFTDRGGNLRPLGDACDCYVGCEFIECQQPPPACRFNPPTMRELKAQGKRVEFAFSLTGLIPDTTPLGQFGPDYYCQPGLWPEACAAGRAFGPVVPPGHPDEAVCVAAFMEAPCPYWKSRCTHPDPNQCPITYDPYFVIGGVNQSHPKNVAAGCDEAGWVKPGGHGQPVEGEWWVATSHGMGHLIACDGSTGPDGKRGTVCSESSFVIDH